MSIMPMRYNIIRQLIHKQDALTPAQLYEILISEYEGEKQCSEKEIDNQLMSLTLAGLVEMAEAFEAKDGTIESAYKITSYGEKRAKKYIGKYL